jgi:CubicO group peptidase (beta-lactamase class C family)
MKQISLIIWSLVYFSSALVKAEGGGEIWLRGTTVDKITSEETVLYFDQWNPQIEVHAQAGHALVLGLDVTLNPFLENEYQLPNLAVLSAISVDSVLANYFSWFEKYVKGNGISHVVLPSVDALNVLEKEVLDIAISTSPYFFIPRNKLFHSMPDSKKEFRSLDDPKIFLASNASEVRKLEKWLRKTNESDFLSKLKKHRSLAPAPAPDISTELQNQLSRSAITIVDENHLLPLHSQVVNYLGGDTQLREWLSNYFIVQEIRTPEYPTIVDLREGNLTYLKNDIVISRDYLEGQENQIIVPYSSNEIPLIIPEILYGLIDVNGRLHGNQHRVLTSQKLLRVSRKAMLDAPHLQRIDSIIQAAINHYATPGAQLLITKKDEIILKKNYGFFTYDSLIPVQDNTLYDLASITKVAATLPAIGLLVDEGKIDLDDSIGTYLSHFIGSNKSKITIKQLLAHQGGLKSYVPFWKLALDGDRLDVFYYRTAEDSINDIRTYGYEPDPSLLDTLKGFIIQSALTKENTYNYSDIGFMILHMIVEEVAGMSFDNYVYERFFKPMHLTSLLFNPLKSGFNEELIAPTEYDHRYRNYQVWGEVHDRNAAVFGGVSGHAGLFGNAHDLAKLLFMLKDGYYGNSQFLSNKTLSTFNTRHFANNRRGLGWDKQDRFEDVEIASPLASDLSYGHTGFSGCMVWVDPEEDLMYIFLSNRIYPDASNTRLLRYNTRTQVQTAIYEALAD